jgi:hypothetical protein
MVKENCKTEMENHAYHIGDTILPIAVVCGPISI